MALLAIALSPSFAQAKPLFGPAEGSRPGETYQSKGQPDQQQAPQYNQQIPQTAQPQSEPGLTKPQDQAQPSSGGAGTLVIMEFSDLQCPDSARFSRELKNTIMQRYVSTGKCSYEWHDFPLPNHPQAMEAAAAARCAGASANSVRQQIMANQGQMSTNVYASYARKAGVNPSSFSTCMRSGTSMQKVQADKALGQSMGVRGTPTLVLGTQDASGNVRPVKLVKGYDPPQQVLAEIDNFIASSSAPRKQQTR